MKIQIWTIGKEDEVYIKAGVEDFTKRISRYFGAEWIIIPPPKNSNKLPIAEAKKKEGEMISSMLKKDDYLVVLDEKGKTMTSQKLANFIQSRANESVKQLVFLIGGAYGIDGEVLRRANYCLSLSEFTFPHQLVRLILAEQIYRACTIIRKEKYHHD
ncbi:MAG: 23S rRNA (pseudouridine(1915)-N(3))-methyltransferase RlmH [Bacteroidetes bacterium]|nr:MAG: 23S rRNA (pseudouridine(1915)-N(3))-methyltransferase RlmH [Bacteroidota bacterium]